MKIELNFENLNSLKTYCQNLDLTKKLKDKIDEIEIKSREDLNVSIEIDRFEARNLIRSLNVEIKAINQEMIQKILDNEELEYLKVDQSRKNRLIKIKEKIVKKKKEDWNNSQK